jgi:hypothetical protein
MHQRIIDNEDSKTGLHDTRQNDIQHHALSITLCAVIFNVTYAKRQLCFNPIMLSVRMLNVVMLSVMVPFFKILIIHNISPASVIVK